MALFVYLSIALVCYLVFLFVEVTYLDLLEARVDTNLTYEALITVTAALVWPVVVLAIVLGAFGSLIYHAARFFNSPKIGWCHRQLGLFVSRCFQKFFSLVKKAKKRCKELKNATALEGVGEASGQNPEGIEAKIG